MKTNNTSIFIHNDLYFNSSLFYCRLNSKNISNVDILYANKQALSCYELQKVSDIIIYNTGISRLSKEVYYTFESIIMLAMLREQRIHLINYNSGSACNEPYFYDKFATYNSVEEFIERNNKNEI